MITEQDRPELERCLRENWPSHKNIDTYVRHCHATANRLNYTLEELLDAIVEHRLDDTEDETGQIRGNHPPNPANIKAQVKLARQRVRDEQHHEAIQQQLDEQKAVQKAIKEGLEAGIPNMPKRISRYTKLVKKNLQAPLVGPEKLELAELAAEFDPLPQYPKVVEYWAKDAQRREGGVLDVHAGTH